MTLVYLVEVYFIIIAFDYEKLELALPYFWEKSVRSLGRWILMVFLTVRQ